MYIHQTLFKELGGKQLSVENVLQSQGQNKLEDKYGI